MKLPTIIVLISISLSSKLIHSKNDDASRRVRREPEPGFFDMFAISDETATGPTEDFQYDPEDDYDYGDQESQDQESQDDSSKSISTPEYDVYEDTPKDESSVTIDSENNKESDKEQNQTQDSVDDLSTTEDDYENYDNYEYDYGDETDDVKGKEEEKEEDEITDDYYDYNYKGADYDYINPENNLDYDKKKTNSNTDSNKNNNDNAKDWPPRQPLPDPKSDVHKDGFCTMRTQCAKNRGHPINCRYNDKAQELEDQQALESYKYLCPRQYKEHGSLTCCDKHQIHVMRESLKPAFALLGRCPICYYNFLEQVCAFTCHPNQSKFVSATSYTYSKDENSGPKDQTGKPSSYTPYDPETGETDDSADPNKVIVTATKFSVSKFYAERMFDSCKGVYNSMTGKPSFEMMCGKWGKNCDGEKLLTFTGDVAGNLYTPFQITYDFKNEDIDRSWMPNIEETIKKCNETNVIDLANDIEIPSCSCTDCENSCAEPDPIPPEEPPFLIMGLDGVKLILAAVLILFVWLIITTAIASHFYIQQRKHKIKAENPWISCIDVSEYIDTNNELNYMEGKYDEEQQSRPKQTKEEKINLSNN